jgi:RNA polymerase sigma factor (TIGR02999 family)
MDATDAGRITLLLHAAQDGDRAAFDEVYGIVYQELRGVARAMRSRAGPPTLNTTALVHEAYLKLVPAPRGTIRDRAHFFGIAARAMRQVLVDAARRRSRARRGGDPVMVEFEESRDSLLSAPSAEVARVEEIVALDEALKQLEQWNPRHARVVECRVFAGLSVEETAEALAISAPTVKRDWQTARAWLAHVLGPG